MIKATIRNSPYCEEIVFPCSEKELSKRLEKLGIAPDHLAPVGTVIEIEPYEIGLTDCDVSLDALNYLGKRMDGMSEGERNQFLAALSCDEDEVGFVWGLKDIINLTFNLERFTLIEDTSDLEKVGLTHMLDIRGVIPKSKLKERSWLAEEGKKLLDSGNGIQTEYGLLFVNEEKEFREVFNGRTFPVYYCDPNAVISVEITYNGLKELVELPTEDIAIKKALYRLGADSLAQCKLETSSQYDITSNWRNKITELEESKDLFALNAMLKSEDVLMKNDSIFKKEITQRLSREEYNFSTENDEIAVTLSGGDVVKIRDKDVLY
ncbi:MAG: hypothetical protein K2N56_04370, partial [Oscillospiraceae bacterium]|nr:hypothetical protein [Oscillospiraceae bacterium]